MNTEADEASKRSVKYRGAKDGKPDTRITAYFKALVGGRAGGVGGQVGGRVGGGRCQCPPDVPPAFPLLAARYPQQPSACWTCDFARFPCPALHCLQLEQMATSATAEGGLGYLTSGQALNLSLR